MREYTICKERAHQVTGIISAKGGSIECLEALVNLDDIDLDIKDHMEGNTPLHKAVEYQSKDVQVAECMVDLLLQGGADPR